MNQLRANETFGQLVRFGIAGGISTLIYVAVYTPLVTWVVPAHWAVLAVPPAFLVAVVCGFFLHSFWSFKGHGTRDQSGKQHAKFLLVQGFGLVLNAIITWVITGPLHGPVWLPLVFVVTLIPIVTFFLNRHWVFG